MNSENRERWAYVIDDRRVVHETIGGEVVAIDNDTGTYFSIEGSGVDVWNALVTGAQRGPTDRRSGGRLLCRYHDGRC